MNARILRGLFMEHATRSWPFLVTGLTLGIAYSSIIFALPDASEVSQDDIEGAVQTIVLFIAALGLLYSAADGERLTCELTERTLLLPVSTFVIVSVKFIYNTSCIVLLSLLAHVILRIVIGGPSEDWWYYPILGATMFVALQTLALAMSGFGDWSFGILFSVFVVMMVMASVSNMGDSTIGLADALVLFVFCLLTSSAVVHLRRTGRWEPESLVPRLLLIHGKSNERPLPPFKSAMDAQRWFEVRRIRFFLVTTLVCSAIAVGLVGVVGRFFTERFMEDYSTNERILWAIGQFGMTFPFIFMWIALVVGVVMAFQNYRTQIGPLRAFLYIRPMSSSDLARARIGGTLRAAALPFLTTVLLTLGLCSFWLLIEKENPSTLLTDHWSVSQLTAILSVIFLGVAAAAWLAYWTGNIIGGAIVVLISGTLELLLHLTGWVNINSEPIVTAVLILIALPICAVLTLAVRVGHLSAARLTLSLFAAAVFALALWFAGYWDDIWSNREIPWNYRELREFGVLALFMALPVASVPLTLHWARHR